jgi:uncharacterized protein (TIGR03067 family)
MPDDFQALPPRATPAPDASLVSDRFAVVSLRKPERPNHGWRWFLGLSVFLLFIFVGIGTVAYWEKLCRTGTAPAAALAPAVLLIDDGPSGSMTIADVERLEGTWLSTAMTIDGEEATGADIMNAEVKTDGEIGRFNLDLRYKVYQGRCRAADGEIDLVDDLANFRARGIYGRNGDTLTICFHESQRPTDFTAEKGSGRTLIVLKKRKPEQIAAPALIEDK